MAKITKQNLVEDLSLHAVFENTPKYKVKEVVDYLFDIIADHVAKGDDVKISGFGRFSKAKKASKDDFGNFVFTNTYKPKFTPYRLFKASVNNG